jgi:hypothetical protein
MKLGITLTIFGVIWIYTFSYIIFGKLPINIQPISAVFATMITFASIGWGLIRISDHLDKSLGK